MMVIPEQTAIEVTILVASPAIPAPVALLANQECPEIPLVTACQDLEDHAALPAIREDQQMTELLEA